MTKRLFIFAAYDADGVVDDSLLFYLRALSKLGDIVFFMDNNTSDYFLTKVRTIPNVLFADAIRHNEYDFGSYKRGYVWAENSEILKNYEWVYFVNDSVFGPIYDLTPILEDLEKVDAGAVGLIDDMNGYYIQSWFFGVPRETAAADWFGNFMRGIKKQDRKIDICIQYERPWSRIVADRGMKLECSFKTVSGRDAYFPERLHPLQFPFIKKQAIKELGTEEKIFEIITDKKLFMAAIANMHRVGFGLRKYKYKKVRRIWLFGIPIITIEKRTFGYRHRAMLFGIIPLGKIT